MATDPPRTIALPGGRVGTLVPADAAGEWAIHVHDHQQAVLKPLLTWRQHTALVYIAKLYGRGGGRRIWAQPGRGQGPDDPVAADEYRDLEAAAGQVMGYQIRTLCMGEWPSAPWLTLRHIADALDRVADQLRLVR